MSLIAPKVAVIGGGPAGLMAAERLSAQGFDVSVFEAKASFGRKFLLAGRGGLNLTHSEGPESFLQRYGSSADFFREKLARFSPSDLCSWCEGLGIGTFVGSSGRVFPETFKASPLLRAWLRRLQDQGVALQTGHRWCGFEKTDKREDAPASRTIQILFQKAQGAWVRETADAVVLAMGGASWPRMGSDGTWKPMLMREGIRCDDFRASNCGFDISWSAHFAERHAGTALKNLRLTSSSQDVHGEIMIARYGIEGGGIYALGRNLREELEAKGEARLVIDLKPGLSQPMIAQKIAAQRAKDSLANRLRKAIRLKPVATALLRECLTREALSSPEAIATAIKELPLLVTGAQPLERAISSVGGVKLENLNSDLMLHALPGVFVVGEMLDWDAPTGGYLLQGTFATAVSAADGVERWLGSPKNATTNTC